MNHIRTKPIEQSPLARRPLSRIAVVNMVLACAALVLIAFYVIQSNSVTVSVWRIRDTQARLAQLHDDRNGLVARQAALDDRQQLTSLAATAGMVPAGSVVYLVQEQPVAAR